MADESYEKIIMEAMDLTKKSRSEIYGDYSGGITLRCTIMNELKLRHFEVHEEDMNPIHEQLLWDVVNKLTRLAVTPDHIDSWHDISVFANLAENFVKEK